MQQNSVLYPMFAMVLLSILVGMRMLQLRFRAVKRDGLQPGYFLMNRGGKAPAYMLQAEQHYVNLYETPMLFYAAVILIYILGITNWFSVVVAWGYTLVRVAHAREHLGKNRLTHRRRIFLMSIMLIATLWIYAFIEVVVR